MPDPAPPHLLGPIGESGAAAPGSFFERILRLSRSHGVTRLADVTGLDRIGLPVWQAVRPAGKSLSVHQGKGATPLAARIGALCEAIEADCAENVAADGPLCSFEDLSPSERAPEIGDYCRMRDAPPPGADPIQWCLATDLATGRPHFLPHDLVSLDFTRGLPNAFERASSGLGAGASETDALRTSLFEAIERDSVGEWQRLDAAGRMETSIELDTIPFGWLQSWRDRFASLGIVLQISRLASIVDIPVFRCVIGGVEEFGSSYRRFSGTSAHGDAEVALFKALAEAIQSRLTLIAGVRDDIMPSYYTRAQPKPAAEGHAPAGRRAWREGAPLACNPDWIAARLTARGYRQIAVKALGGGPDGIAVTKVFIPGLGSSTRTRRVAP